MNPERSPFASPFLSDYPAPEREDEQGSPPPPSPGLAGLLFESPYLRLALGGEAPQGLADEFHDLQGWLAEEEAEAESHGGPCGCRECELAFELEGDDGEARVFELEAQPDPAASQLSAEQRAWVLDIERSALERLPDAAQRLRYLQQVNWKDIEFPGNVPRGETVNADIRAHWQLADELFLAMAVVTPERRVNTGARKIKFRAHRPVSVPGQSARLYSEAAEAFGRMHAAAAQEGVTLTIGSSWRSAAHQAGLSQAQPNALAVAKGNSAHMYGLAIDLQLAVRGLSFSAKSYTRSAEKMALLVRMYRSPAYKWMMLRGKSFGWYPYRREPWHWEYNPPGLKARFEGGSATVVETPRTVETPVAGQPTTELVRFAQQVLNAAEGERLSVDGDLGSRTREALQRFRAKYQLGGSAAIDTGVETALMQRALEELAQASMFAQTGLRDTRTDEAIARFRAERGLGFGALLDAATRRALAQALAGRVSTARRNAVATPPATPQDHRGGLTWVMRSPSQSVDVAVFVPRAALRQSQVDLLLYAHGLLGGCPRPPSGVPGGFITEGPFDLGRVVDESGLPAVLAVPLLDWNQPGGAAVFGPAHPRWHALAHPTSLNLLASEVLADVGRVQAMAAPAVQRLVVAGHSRAYDFLEPLAVSFNDPQMQQSALARLAQVWAFDTTYGGQLSNWQRWLAARPGLKVHFFYRQAKGTQAVGDAFYAARNASLNVWRVTETHCEVPPRRMLPLLKALASGAEHELTEGEEEAPLLFEDGEEPLDGEGEFGIDTATSDEAFTDEHDHQTSDDEAEAPDTDETMSGEAFAETLLPDDEADLADESPEAEFAEGESPQDLFELATEAELEAADQVLAEAEAPEPGWQGQVFRAVFAGERRVNALIKIGRDAGGTDPKTVRDAVLKTLRVPFPKAAQAGGVPCEQQVRKLAPARPDKPRVIFTGRYEATRADGGKTFWAINQAGNTLVAIRTLRGFTTRDGGKGSQMYRELRGDLQADGSAVLFQVDDPSGFWGCLQQQPDRSMRWLNGSYIGADGQRVFVDGDSERDETLQLSADNRPTMMLSLYKSDDPYLNVLLQQREWYPLTKGRYDFLMEGARADVLRDLLAEYLATPVGITYVEKQAKQKAEGRVVNYMQHLLWDGVPARKPDVMSLDAVLKAHGTRARRLFPQGHHNNVVLATHVAKLWLAHEKLNHAGEKRSFLDWLTKLVQERQQATLARLLDVPLRRSANAGIHRYRLTLEMVSAGFWVGGGEGTLRVEKLSAPHWPGSGALLYDVHVFTLGKPKAPAREEIFDLELSTAQEWMPDDFEGSLWLGEITASVGIKGAKGGVTALGGYLRSKNGQTLGFEDADVFAKPGGSGGKQGKPKFKVRAEGMAGRVRRKTDKLLDLSQPFPSNRTVVGDLASATHFCFGSSLLTPAARQLLRVVCADQLAALDNVNSQVRIVGHTDRPDTDMRNDELSTLRAKNVRTALNDILGPALKVPESAIQTVGMGELLAKAQLRPEQVRNPADRRVDLLVNGRLVARFRG
jgi:outer membrane protein OmpA-like peptidoglycan-associated protein/LAS superfamily LD-carboxypeptidase LdcB